MKTLAYAAVLTALTAAGAHAQTAYEVRSSTTTETVDGVTTQTTTEYVSSTAVIPQDGVIVGDEAATPDVEAAGSVSVKLPDGTVVNIPDSADAPWNRDPRLQGYDRFTFDPVNNTFVAGKGEAKFAGNWDENGNRVQKAAPAPKKKKAAPVEEKPADEPAPETPADEPASEPVATEPTVDAPAEETPAGTPAAQ